MVLLTCIPWLYFFFFDWVFWQALWPDFIFFVRRNNWLVFAHVICRVPKSPGLLGGIFLVKQPICQEPCSADALGKETGGPLVVLTGVVTRMWLCSSCLAVLGVHFRFASEKIRIYLGNKAPWFVLWFPPSPLSLTTVYLPKSFLSIHLSASHLSVQEIFQYIFMSVPFCIISLALLYQPSI